jgi:hypothetical protein
MWHRRSTCTSTAVVLAIFLSAGRIRSQPAAEVLRFGKLMMTDADLEIIDQSPGSPFDFSLPNYNRQLVAGYSKNTPRLGLIVFMPDLTTLSGRKP